MSEKKGIKSYADLNRARKERERVAGAYRKWAFDVTMSALIKAGLADPGGLPERVGVMNGMVVAATTLCKANGATKIDLLRIVDELYDDVDVTTVRGNAASPELARPSAEPNAPPQLSGPEKSPPPPRQ